MCVGAEGRLVPGARGGGPFASWLRLGVVSAGTWLATGFVGIQGWSCCGSRSGGGSNFLARSARRAARAAPGPVLADGFSSWSAPRLAGQGVLTWSRQAPPFAPRWRVDGRVRAGGGGRRTPLGRPRGGASRAVACRRSATLHVDAALRATVSHATNTGRFSPRPSRRRWIEAGRARGGCPLPRPREAQRPLPDPSGRVTGGGPRLGRGLQLRGRHPGDHSMTWATASSRW